MGKSYYYLVRFSGDAGLAAEVRVLENAAVPESRIFDWVHARIEQILQERNDAYVSAYLAVEIERRLSAGGVSPGEAAAAALSDPVISINRIRMQQEAGYLPHDFKK